MKMYSVIKLSKETKKSEIEGLTRGFTLDEEQSPEEILKTADEAEAYKELKKHEPELYVHGSIAVITEYWVEEYEADEDGEFLSGSDYDTAYEWEIKDGEMQIAYTIQQAREMAGMSRADVIELIGMPYRTLQDWELGNSNCPDYVERLIVEKIFKNGNI